MKEAEEKLIRLYKSWCGMQPTSVIKLPGSGSYRSYYRLAGPGETVIGAHNEDILENQAYFSFTQHFMSEGLPVPSLLASDPVNRVYLITDLGDTTLYQFLTERRGTVGYKPPSSGEDSPGNPFSPEIIAVYKKALAWLPVFQVKAGKTLDYKVCYPRGAFDRQSMMWDLNYFKYYFLKLAKIPFDEQTLEDDFQSLCNLLLKTEADFFLYRDFQSRNIMIVNGEPWFIDFQGGRKGALQYDVASLLTDGKADIPMKTRNLLLDFYLNKLGEIYPVDREKFMKIYHGFVLIRILQALGAYGFRGYYENKPHFLQSIPFALRNLGYLLDNNLVDIGLKSLILVIGKMIDNPLLYNQQPVEVIDDKYRNVNNIKNTIINDNLEKKLTVTIHSFSYKKSIPFDAGGNGGGFVFDCRALPNPGRYDEFRHLNGKDQPVIEFLRKEHSVGVFLNHVRALVGQSVETYIGRDFDQLMVSFGCTGGQHRSVYCAEELAEYLKTKYNLKIKLLHDEQDKT